MHLSRKEIEELDRIKRLNLINSITGIKPANLIGTKSKNGHTNLAIFSSIVHLGSNPPLIGFISRPTGEVPRHTIENILETEYYTINHVIVDDVKKAHYTSAKFERDESEFSNCSFEEEYVNDFYAPFVKGSQIKIGVKLVDQLHIKQNGTILFIGEIMMISAPDDVISDEGYIDLGEAKSAGISGLNSYYNLSKIDSFPYARVHEIPEWEK